MSARVPIVANYAPHTIDGTAPSWVFVPNAAPPRADALEPLSVAVDVGETLDGPLGALGYIGIAVLSGAGVIYGGRACAVSAGAGLGHAGAGPAEPVLSRLARGLDPCGVAGRVVE